VRVAMPDDRAGGQLRPRSLYVTEEQPGANV